MASSATTAKHRASFAAKISLAATALLCSAALLCFAEAPKAYAADGTATVSYKVDYNQSEAYSMLSMINSFRTGSDAWYYAEDGSKVKCSGLKELVYDKDLEAMAMQRAAEIVLRFGHTRPNSDSCWTASSGAGYEANCFGENCAAGYGTAKSAFEGWQETDEDYSGQGHRRNMLGSSHTAVGIACVEYDGICYWVQEFGAPGAQNSSESCKKDSSATATVEVDLAAATIKSAKPSYSSKELLKGKAMAAPSVSAQIGFDSTWPYSYCTVNPVGLTWQVQDASVLSLNGSQVTGLKSGSTTLSTIVLGKSVSSTVKVVSKYTNPMKVSKSTKTVKYSKVKKKAQTVKPLKVTKAKGKVTYKKSSGSKKITVNKKTGKITVKKGTKKGTYSIKVKVKAAGSGDYASATKAVTVKVKVK